VVRELLGSGRARFARGERGREREHEQSATVVHGGIMRYVSRMTSATRTVTVMGALLTIAAAFACVPDTTSTSSGASGTASGGGIESAGGDDASSVPADRQQLCSSYASATAACCAQTTECPTTSATDWNKHCLAFARSCPAMPTCFSGTDCNT